MRSKLVWIAALSALTLVGTADFASARGRHGGCGGCGGGGGCGSGGGCGCYGYSGCGGCGYGGGCGCYGYSGCGYGGCGYGGCGYGGGYCDSCGYGGGWGGGYGGGYCPTCYAYAPAPAAPATAVAQAPATDSATLIVTLPENARLRVDDFKTASTSGERVFHTPSLKVGQDFHYTLTAEIDRGGKVETVSREVTVRAGETTRVNLGLSVQTVAAR